MLMPSCEFNHLRHFCFRDLVSKDPAYTHAVPVDVKHDLNGLLATLVEESLQNMNDELHRCVVVIEKKHLVEARLLGFRACFGDDAGSGAAISLSAIVAPVSHEL